MELFEFLEKAVTPYQSVDAIADFLEQEGFREQKAEETINTQRGGAYYIRLFGTGLMAYTVGGDFSADDRMHLAAAHTDTPCLRIKPKAELSAGAYKRLDVEVYGGGILNTWFDRPLSLAGRVVLRGDKIYEPKVVSVDFKRPLMTVPNLAIHMNREVNKGVEYKPQRDLLPLLGIFSEEEDKDGYFLSLLAEEIGVDSEEILDFDLTVYCVESPVFLGAKQEFISAPRLDNQVSCYALMQAVAHPSHKRGLHAALFYDHEEVGSRSKQGADSALTGAVLERIMMSLGLSGEETKAMIARSILLSVDVAHALHPNRQEVYDPVNHVILNRGIALKISNSQRYAFDAQTVGIVQMLCEKAQVPFQKIANHNDILGGTTLGPIISSWLPMRTIDIGIPLLAMHSARELVGKKDTESMRILLTLFLKEDE